MASERQYCVDCDDRTGRSSEDAIYVMGHGPLCERCSDARDAADENRRLHKIVANLTTERDTLAACVERVRALPRWDANSARTWRDDAGEFVKYDELVAALTPRDVVPNNMENQ